MPDLTLLDLNAVLARMFDNALFDRDFLMALRQLALQFVDVVERKLNILPRTAELRKEAKILYNRN